MVKASRPTTGVRQRSPRDRGRTAGHLAWSFPTCLFHAVPSSLVRRLVLGELAPCAGRSSRARTSVLSVWRAPQARQRTRLFACARGGISTFRRPQAVQMICLIWCGLQRPGFTMIGYSAPPPPQALVSYYGNNQSVPLRPYGHHPCRPSGVGPSCARRLPSLSCPRSWALSQFEI